MCRYMFRVELVILHNLENVDGCRMEESRRKEGRISTLRVTSNTCMCRAVLSASGC